MKKEANEKEANYGKRGKRMLIARNNEEKRDKIWKWGTLAASVTIVVIVAYFLWKGFFSNPIDGVWQCEDNDIILHIDNDDKALVQYEDQEVVLEYNLELNEKRISFKENKEQKTKVSSDMESVLESLHTTFNYNLEDGILTLTDWDYGEQLSFTEVK